MKIRLNGTAEECNQAARVLSGVLDVISVSDPYPDRGRSRLVRVYVEAQLGHKRTPSEPPETDQPRHRRATLRRLDRELPTQ